MKPLLPVMKEKVSFGTQLFNAFILTFLLQSHLLLTSFYSVSSSSCIHSFYAFIVSFYFLSISSTRSFSSSTVYLITFFQDFITYSLWNA
jgi:hypothetical protein